MGWKNLKLWNSISEQSKKHHESFLASITICMNNIEEILKSAGTSPLDFTLHDDQHSFRVATRMCEIISPDTFDYLSTYEKVLLLMSAYLHDIGMTPTRGTVSKHYKYFSTGDESILLSDDLIHVEEWLDNNYDGKKPPFYKANPLSADELDKIELLTTHYCRYRHNDWSEQWIRENIKIYGAEDYSHFIEHLVLLCKSHHYGYKMLSGNAFDFTKAGNQNINLRYLASVLRISDVLEFDPKRTPDVVFQHRTVSEGSKIYWAKDHEFSFTISKDVVAIHARPVNAFLHKAIKETAEQVEHELKICSRLSIEKHFDRSTINGETMPYKWILPSSLHSDILPFNNSYDYIDGAFRPDTKRILELLSGTSLYGSPIHAVREILQNSFDAVKEQIAYERLNSENPLEDGLDAVLSASHRIKISLIEKEDAIWLCCEDTGSGMSKYIIDNYLLVGGKSQRHDLLKLQRDCLEKGFGFSRTGSFGIGVLSYFMLGDFLKIETRRSLESNGEPEENGWSFSTAGVDSFGELKKIDRTTKGTKVELRLKKSLFEDVSFEKWSGELIKYIKSIVVKSPCKIKIEIDAKGLLSQHAISYGWSLKQTDLTDKVVRKFQSIVSSQFGDSSKHKFLSRKEEQEIASLKKKNDENLNSFKNSLRWLTKEIHLPDDIGLCRINVFYFVLPKGNSLVYMNPKEASSGVLELKKVINGFCVDLPSEVIGSWKGISIGLDNQGLSGMNYRSRINFEHDLPNCIVDLDLHKNSIGEISVDRKTIKISSNSAKGLKSFLKQESLNLLNSIDLENSIYNSINSQKCGMNQLSNTSAWIHFDMNSPSVKATWKKISYPIMRSVTFSYEDFPKANFYLGRRAVTILPSLNNYPDKEHYKGVCWKNLTNIPDKIVLLNKVYGYKYSLAPIWIKPAVNIRRRDQFGIYSSFSPRWRCLTGVRLPSYDENTQSQVIWNPDNILVRQITEEDWGIFSKNFRQFEDPLEDMKLILSKREFSAAWLLQTISQESGSLWSGLIDSHPEFVQQAIDLAYNGSKRESLATLFYVEKSTSSGIRVVSSTGWLIETNINHIAARLGDPGATWTVSSQDLLEWRA